MCRSLIILCRCGHEKPTRYYCPDHWVNPRTGNKMMCDNRTTTRSDQTQSLCNRPDCLLRQIGGAWTCCMCGNGPNRYGRCTFTEEPDSNRECLHAICEECPRYVPQRRRQNVYPSPYTNSGHSRHILTADILGVSFF
ncbi:hypothetical protein F5Y09DRAFT_326679 [Xylaria sp. FL1042]|nr:hypothetical protein F5Y09DRAFT_326679 [Xylaria sp. FL1042]